MTLMFGALQPARKETRTFAMRFLSAHMIGQMSAIVVRGIPNV